MTQEEKQLLLKDLCARLPYGVKINIRNDYTLTMEDMELNAYHLTTASYDIEYRGLRPYLRPMSSMTEEEYKEYDRLIRMSITVAIPPGASIMKPEYIVDLEDDGDGLNRLYDWLNAHHFDYRGLMPMGLALEAPEGMYKQ